MSDTDDIINDSQLTAHTLILSVLSYRHFRVFTGEQET